LHLEPTSMLKTHFDDFSLHSIIHMFRFDINLVCVFIFAKEENQTPNMKKELSARRITKVEDDATSNLPVYVHRKVTKVRFVSSR